MKEIESIAKRFKKIGFDECNTMMIIITDYRNLVREYGLIETAELVKNIYESGD